MINTVEPYELTLALVLFDINLSVYLKKTKRKKRNGFCKLRKCAEENNDVGKEKYAVISSLIKPQKKKCGERRKLSMSIESRLPIVWVKRFCGKCARGLNHTSGDRSLSGDIPPP